MTGFQPMLPAGSTGPGGFRVLRETARDLPPGFEPMISGESLPALRETLRENGARAEAQPEAEEAVAGASPLRSGPESGQGAGSSALGDESIDMAALRVREQAFEAGRHEGIEAGRREMAERLAAVEDLLVQISGLREELFSRALEDIADCVLHVSKSVLRRELKVSRSGIAELVRSVLQQVQGEDEIVLRLAPEDDRAMREVYPTLLEGIWLDTQFRVDPDPRLQSGGAVVETRYGRIDASVEAQVEAFAESVRGWLKNNEESDE